MVCFLLREPGEPDPFRFLEEFRMTRLPRLLPILMASLVAMVACGDAASREWLDDLVDPDPAGQGGPLPRESEIVSLHFLGVAPAVTEEYLYVANPSLDSISRIGIARPHTIDLIRTGLEPGLIHATPTDLLVLNEGEHSVSLVHRADHSVRTLRLPKDINDVAHHGNYALGFVNRERVTDSDLDGGTRALDVITALDIPGRTAVSRALGFAPAAIRFAGTWTALVAGENRAALLDLRTAAATPVPFTSASLPEIEEALLTPDGAWALFRLAGNKGLRAVRLANGEAATVAAGITVSDAELGPDGASLYVAEADNDFRLHRYAVGAAAITPVTTVTVATPYTQVELTPDGTRALLFAGGGSVAGVGILATADGGVLEAPVVRPVSALWMAPDSGTAILAHEGDGAGGFFSRAALTLLNLDTGEAPAIELEGDLHGLAFSPDGAFAFVTTKSPDYLLTLSLRNGLYRAEALGEAPLFLGVLPLAGGHAFVTQEHDAGRILFLDVTDTLASVEHETEILTGYLLGTHDE